MLRSIEEISIESVRAAYGVRISHGSIHNWRSETRTPVVIKDRIEASIKLSADDSFNKDYAYLSLAGKGVRNRRTRTSLANTEASRVLASNGFSEDIAEEAGINSDTVRRTIRSIRAEIVFDPYQYSKDHQAIFISTVGSYLDDYKLPQVSKNVENYKLIEKNWDRTIHHFYQLLYGIGQPRMIGGWTPYEVAFMRYFYQDRIAKGSRLSALDKLILESYRDAANLTDLAGSVRKKTSIQVSAIDLAEHRNYLLFGKPHNPDLLSIRK